MKRMIPILLLLFIVAGCTGTDAPSPTRSPAPAVTATPDTTPASQLTPGESAVLSPTPGATPESAQGDVLEVDAEEDAGVGQ